MLMASEPFACTWPAPPRVRTLVTTRCGGVSAAPYDSFNLGDHVGDESSSVVVNRERLRRRLPAPPLWLRQVHGTAIADGDRADSWATGPVEADACVTHHPGRVCAVLVADCLPVLFCDKAGSVVAAAHAGWRGLSAGVLEATIAQLDSPADQLLAWLGPAIGRDAFEVGEDVLQAFGAAQDAQLRACFVPSGASASGQPRWRADLFALARLRLQHCGVHGIHGGEDCTYSQPERYFSHRRDKRTGRQAALIWLE